jgi:hypothetical protein
VSYLIVIPGLCQQAGLEAHISQLLLEAAEHALPVVPALHVQTHEVLPLEGRA